MMSTVSKKPSPSKTIMNIISNVLTETSIFNSEEIISYISLISHYSSETSNSTIITHEKTKNKAKEICGIMIPLNILMILLDLTILLLKRKQKLCFGGNNIYSNEIDLLQSNSPIVDSNQADLMSGKEDAFEKISHKDVFDYSLVV